MAGPKMDVELHKKCCANPDCGKVFLPRHDRQLFCSKVCAAQARKSVPPEERLTSKFRETPILRRCHDCGVPTPDYRCRYCRERWRMRHHLPKIESEN